MTDFRFYIGNMNAIPSVGASGANGSVPTVEILTKTATEYVLKITNPDGSEIITPNLIDIEITDNGGEFLMFAEDSPTSTTYPDKKFVLDNSEYLIKNKGTTAYMPKPLTDLGFVFDLTADDLQNTTWNGYEDVLAIEAQSQQNRTGSALSTIKHIQEMLGYNNMFDITSNSYYLLDTQTTGQSALQVTSQSMGIPSGDYVEGSPPKYLRNYQTLLQLSYDADNLCLQESPYSGVVSFNFTSSIEDYDIEFCVIRNNVIYFGGNISSCVHYSSYAQSILGLTWIQAGDKIVFNKDVTDIPFYISPYNRKAYHSTIDPDRDD